MQGTTGDRNYEMMQLAIVAKNATEQEIRESVAPGENERLSKRLKRQREKISELACPLAWDW